MLRVSKDAGPAGCEDAGHGYQCDDDCSLHLRPFCGIMSVDVIAIRIRSNNPICSQTQAIFDMAQEMVSTVIAFNRYHQISSYSYCSVPEKSNPP